MSTYLVTGGAGFIGSNLVEALMRAGEEVRVLDDFSTGRRVNLEAAEEWARDGGRLQVIEGDLRRIEDCTAACAGADFVLHQAAVPSVPRSVAEPILTNAVNVGGTLNLLEAARQAGVKRFVSASSSSLYGESEELPKVETMRTAPISPYGLQKLAAESYCGLYHRLYGLPTIALRYFNVFGPRQDPHSEYAAVVPAFIRAITAGESPTIYGDGEQTRDFTFIGNVVQANLKACEAGQAAFGKAINIACGERISLNQLARQIGELSGKPVQVHHTEPREGDIRHSIAGIELAGKLIGYDPAIALGEGLRRTIEAF